MPSIIRKSDPAGIVKRIFVLRGQRLLLDSDLAELHGVTPKRLNEQVRRNRERFPEDFVFQLEFNELRKNWSQIATSSRKYRGPKRPPLASNADLARKLETLESSVAMLDAGTKKRFEEVYSAIRALMVPPAPKSRPIGFTADIDKKP